VSLDTSSAEYWDFNQEQMGLYDVPAFIDHIKSATGQSKVTYIGHSEGTTQVFYGAALKHRYYENNVNLFVALAPIANLYNVQVPAFHSLATYWREVQLAAKTFGVYNTFEMNWWEDEAVKLFCLPFGETCKSFLAYFADMDPSVDNLSRGEVFLNNFPVGQGYQCVINYAQNVNNPEFRRFNYGEIENLTKYFSVEPPAVPLNKISIPTALVSGNFDLLGDAADIKWLTGQLPAETVVFNRAYDLGHLSFSLAKDMSWFSEDVMSVIHQYKTNNYNSSDEFSQ